MTEKTEGGPDLLNRAARLLGRRRYSVAEMRAKLAGPDSTGEEIDQVIDYLLERGYLNDLEYARAFVSDRTRMGGKGSLLIRRELTARGIAREMGEEVLREQCSPQQELERAQDLLFKWSRAGSKTDDQLLRKLASRGFPADICLDALRRLQSAQNS